MFPGLVELCKEFEDRFFIILTNGTALTASTYERLKHSTNIVVVVSIEGGKDLTDARRGQGVYSQARAQDKQIGSSPRCRRRVEHEMPRETLFPGSQPSRIRLRERPRGP
jgi:hypothetical protein